jgi:hypothetical protein
MRHLRRFCAALTLACAFTLPALASDGEMHTGIAPPPPPPTVAGEMSAGLPDVLLSFIETVISFG